MNERFCDVHFRQLIAEPIGTVERVYAHFGIELSSEARRAMQLWLDDPANRSPKGRHTLADLRIGRDSNRPGIRRLHGALRCRTRARELMSAADNEEAAT